MPVSPEQWTQIKALFEEALSLPGAERAQFLDNRCGDDDEIRVEVERLLASEKQAEEYFDTLGEHISGATSTPDPAPETIDAWRIVGEAGRGGMGAVYEAVRDDGLFDQRVAIKVVDSHAPGIVKRFEQERRLLGKLEHPNICRVLDAGALEDGRPYLVMEYVDGEPITMYADQRSLTLEKRLQLFIEVCNAVSFAHKHLIIHRDLKPSNVFVAQDGTVKLLDFGIATIVREDETPDQLLTDTGKQLLTPHFAAPEQVLNGVVTTSTDVYALGVLLYVLLTGNRPFGPTDSSRHEVEREVLEREPTAPSMRVMSSAEERKQSSTNPAWLSRRLKGDLDRIVLKALRKEPERRYVSVEALGRDIQRHLDGLPVEARSATIGYRARSFFKRHRAGVVASALVLAVLVTGSAWFMNRIATERDRAEYVSEFLADILARADESGANPTALLPLLDPAVEQAERELASEPATQADVFQVVGTLYGRSGRSDLARTLTRRALDIREALYPGGHEDIAESLYEMGDLFIGVDRDSSVFYFRQSAEHYRSLSGEDSDELAWSLLQWARMLPEDHPEKTQLFEEAVAMMRRVHGERSTEVADAMHEYYVLGYGGGTHEQIIDAFEQSIEIYAENGLEGHPYSIHAMHNLGLGLDKEDPERALDLLQRSVDLAKQHITRGTQGRLTMEVNLGATLNERGFYEEAHEILSESATEALRYLPDSASGLAQSHYWYGRNLLALARVDEAIGNLTHALEIQQFHEPEGPRAYRIVSELALAQHMASNQTDAERMIRRAVESLRDNPFWEERALRHALVITSSDVQQAQYRARLEELESNERPLD